MKVKKKRIGKDYQKTKTAKTIQNKVYLFY